MMCFNNNNNYNSLTHNNKSQRASYITPENLKTELKQFSIYLRRDFLCVLVKLASRQFGIHLNRTDWRTRTGMLSFIQRNWEQISIALRDPSNFIGWYAINFEFNERILSDKKFTLYLSSIWDKYCDFFNNHETNCFMRSNSNEIVNAISKNENVDGYSFVNTKIGQTLAEIIKKFKNVNEFHGPSIIPPPIPSQIHSVPEQLPNVPSIQDTFINDSSELDMAERMFRDNEDYSVFETFQYAEEIIF
ncbi:hypothetical protein TVAG_077200 [Trichomonas vaginalis G3]|uniref:Uncharacterized protein n=1 Tax=Trichomonas vaginalis (strain ATCC PRA-98 / G3) TaxID=412133 RepID=A2D9W7_TRIV3|nr:hypothetical protein TVAGG3_0291110 [Trichomonas vaginalis G3]EAY22973.1 hypothetical protein TVAG_077200 [Trichomonas vaginalis G3]KAI5527275.1 hypothetical protein TVAGG3_0291110 [Trichomonas vaginalis G3]|eukprot:XP_001583959.1 hypothetical protein [Trichomonas vaginalis G3]